MTNRTPLEKLQGEAAARLSLSGIDNRAALDAFLVQAFDLGTAAHKALVAELSQPLPGLADAVADGHVSDH